MISHHGFLYISLNMISCIHSWSWWDWGCADGDLWNIINKFLMKRCWEPRWHSIQSKTAPNVTQTSQRSMSAEIRDTSLIQIISVYLIRGIASVNYQTNNDQNILRNSWHISFTCTKAFCSIFYHKRANKSYGRSRFLHLENLEKKRVSTASQMRWRLISGSLITC